MEFRGRHDLYDVERGPGHVVAEQVELSRGFKAIQRRGSATTHVCELEDGAGLELHVLALYFLPDLVDDLGDELALVLFVGPQTANEVLQGALPHRGSVSEQTRSRRSSCDTALDQPIIIITVHSDDAKAPFAS
jgi:hypothetical protein